MQIFLKNESNKTIILHIDNAGYTLIPDAGRYIETEKETFNLTVSADEKYRCDPVTSKLGLSYFHRFVIASEYTVTAKENCTIRFYSETAHGNNFESYTRIYPFSNDCAFSPAFYSVNNENDIKDKIEKSDKTEAVILQGAGVAGKLIKAKNALDDIVAGVIIGVIALVIFILLWIFKDFRTAVTIYGAVAFFGFLIWKLFLEKVIERLKRKAKKKTDEKFGKMFLPCEDMPEGIFKGKESYFSHDYIAAVFKHSSKKI